MNLPGLWSEVSGVASPVVVGGGVPGTWGTAGVGRLVVVPRGMGPGQPTPQTYTTNGIPASQLLRHTRQMAVPGGSTGDSLQIGCPGWFHWGFTADWVVPGRYSGNYCSFGGPGPLQWELLQF